MFIDALASWTFHTSDRELGGQPTFTLEAVRELDRAEPHPLALPGALGDSVLLNRVKPYETMRRTLLELGYQFVDTHELSVSNRIVPDLALLPTLRGRTLNYRRMARAADELIAIKPSARFDDYGFTRAFGFNNTAHEGSHALVFEAALAAEGQLEGPTLVEALIAGEAFAMSFELWVALLTMNDARRSTPLFLAINSPASPFGLKRLETEPGHLARLAQLAQHKPDAFMTLYAAAGLVANLRPGVRTVQPQLVQFLCEYAGIDPVGERLEADLLVNLGLSLDEEFRSTIAPTFFRFHDLLPQFEAVCRLPLEHHFTGRGLFHRHLPTCLRQVRA